MAQAVPKGERRCRRREEDPWTFTSGTHSLTPQGSSWGPAQHHHHDTEQAPLTQMETRPLLPTTAPSPQARRWSPLVFWMWATPEATAAVWLSPQPFSANTRKE